MKDYVHAISFGYGEPRGFLENTAAWQFALREMIAATGCNAVVLTVAALQDHAYSTQVDFDAPDVMSMRDVLTVSRYIKSLGLMLIVKVMVNCRDGYWRAYIRFFDTFVPTEPTWGEWFASYGAFVKALAETAQEVQADMFCAGCEMVGTDHRETDWRCLIAEGGQALKNPWVRGTAFWDFSVRHLYPRAYGAYDTGYSVYGKPAEGVLKEFGQLVKSGKHIL